MYILAEIYLIGHLPHHRNVRSCCASRFTLILYIFLLYFLVIHILTYIHLILKEQKWI